MQRALPLLAALGLAAAVAGCGSSSGSVEDFEGDERAVAQTVDDLSEAGREGDARRICTQLLAADLVRRLRANDRDCVTAIDNALDDADNYSLEVEDVTVKGTTATAKIDSGGDARQETLQLVKQGRGWRIASIGA